MPEIKPGEYHFASLIQPSQDAEGDISFSLRTHGTLSKDDYLIYQSHKRIVLRYFDNAKLIKIVILNFNELISRIGQHKHEFYQSRKVNEKIIENIYIDVGRLILNLLSAFRSFADHTESMISRDFGKSSTELHEWKSFLSQQYDTSFAYRFFYKLRNYAQHIGMPPLQITLTDHLKPNTSDILFHLNMNDLIVDKSVWGAQMYRELLNIKTDINLMPLLIEWDNSISALIGSLHSILLPKSTVSAGEILKYRLKYSVDSKARVAIVLPTLMNTTPPEMSLSIDWLPEEKASIILDSGSPE